MGSQILLKTPIPWQTPMRLFRKGFRWAMVFTFRLSMLFIL